MNEQAAALIIALAFGAGVTALVYLVVKALF
jgi:hypothetical protein